MRARPANRGPRGTGRRGPRRGGPAIPPLTGSQASSGSGARPGRRSSQAAPRRPAVHDRDVDPEGTTVEEELGQEAEGQAGGEDAARAHGGRPGTWWASDGSLRNGPVGRAGRPRRSGLGRCVRRSSCRPCSWHDARHDRPGRALRPDRRRLRAVVGARAGAGGRDAPRPDSQDGGPRPVRASSTSAPGTGQLAIATLERWPRPSVDGDRRLGRDDGPGRTPRPTGASRPRSAPRFSTTVAFADELPFADGTFDLALSSFVAPARPEPARAPCARSAACCGPAATFASSRGSQRRAAFRARRRSSTTLLDDVRRSSRADGDGPLAATSPSVDRRGRRAAPRRLRGRDGAGRRARRTASTVEGYIGVPDRVRRGDPLRRASTPTSGRRFLADAARRLAALDAGADDDALPDRLRDRADAPR